jgi:fucose permease
VTRRQSILAIACLSMVSFGIVLTTLGASLPSVIALFGIDMQQAGALLSLLSFSVLAGSVVFGPIVDRRGYKMMLLFAFSAIIVGLEAVAFASSLVGLRLGLVLIGFSGGMVNGAANALVADVSAERRGAALSFVGAFFGVGAAGVPFVLSTLSGFFSQPAILGVIAGFVLLPLAFTAGTSFPPPKQPRGISVADARRLLSDPLLLLMGLMLFLESGMETTVGGWTPTFFVEELNVSPDRAPIYLALFWVGLMLARLTVGLLLKTTSGVRVLLVSVGVALVGALVLVSTRSVAFAATGIFLLGCGFAPVFPVMFGFVGDRYAQLSGTALSLVITIALVGGMLMPYAAGVLGNAYGLRGSFVLVPAALASLAVLLIAVSRRLTPVTPEAVR